MPNREYVQVGECNGQRIEGAKRGKCKTERRETDSFPILQTHGPRILRLCLVRRLTGVDKMAWKYMRNGVGVATYQTDKKSGVTPF